jgi:hypothetical protein
LFNIILSFRRLKPLFLLPFSPRLGGLCDKCTLIPAGRRGHAVTAGRQDPEDWDDADTLRKEGLSLEGLGIPDVDSLTSDEEAGEGEKGDEMEEEEVVVEEEAAHLHVPSPIQASSEEEDEEEVEDEEGPGGGRR